MFQLLLTVFAIALTAIVVAGGVGYLNTEFGVRRTTTETVVTSYRAFDGAVSAYRISNGGAAPPSSTPSRPASADDGEPWSSLRPYLAGGGSRASVSGALVPIKGMEWTYRYGSDLRGYLCLSSGSGSVVPSSVREGLEGAVAKTGGAFLGTECGTAGPVAAGTDSPMAATFFIQSGQ